MKFVLRPLLITICLCPMFAQPARRAILADGNGPWRDDRWIFAVREFSGLLKDAGYSVTTVSPVDLPSALGKSESLLAVPSLESLPFDTFRAVVAHLTGGGSLMASGGEPFRDPLYLTADGKWLNAEAYRTKVGSPPPYPSLIPPNFETLYPSRKQYTNSSGLRVPIARGRGLSATPDLRGRYRVIGDLLAPAATFYASSDHFLDFGNSGRPGPLVIWLPWAQLFDPLRAQFVSALRGAANRLHLLSAGPEQIVWLPGETVTGRANILNATGSPMEAVLQWSISGSSAVSSQPGIRVSVPAGEVGSVPVDLGRLPNGDYTVNFRLMIGDEEIDRIDSPVRVFDPTSTRQPDQKIRVVNGAFSAGDRHVFLLGVNYWPRYIVGVEPYRFNGLSWLGPDQYDPDLIEADLTEIAALNFNLVNIQFGDLQGDFVRQGRALIDFLERCRHHGIWVRIALRATIGNEALTGMMNPALGSYLQYASLAGNDRVFAYELLWEPLIGSHDQGGQGGYVNGVYAYNLGRLILDPAWRTWVDEQYGSLANAEQIWAFTAPRDAKGQLTNPLDDQITSDGPWRIMVAAYRRFTEDYLGRNLGVIAREIRRSDPDTLLTYRNWVTMTTFHNFSTGYDIGTAAAHLDFFSPERYSPQFPWPEDRGYGLVVAYSRYRTGGKPVHWTEFGYDIGPNNGTPATRSAQASTCDAVMHQVSDDGSNAASVWWWPGGYHPDDNTDFGIIDPDGNPRDCALVMSEWGAKFAAAAPDLKQDPAVTLTVDRDSDARGSYGLFLKWQNSYVQARQGGHSVKLVDEGTGTNTSTMPLTQVGNAPYAGVGPLKFANAEFAGIRVVCPRLDVTVENGATVAIPSGDQCQIAPVVVNTGEAQWNPTSAAGGVTLHTNVGDAPLTASLAALQRIGMGPIAVTMGQSATTLSGRLRIQGVGDFGEVLNLKLVADATVTGPCAISLSSAASITASSGGANGSITITTAPGCAWKASSPQPWVTVGPASGSGIGALTYNVQPNTGPARQATILIADRPFTVTQDGISIPSLVQAPAVSATSLNFGSQTVGAIGTARGITLTNTGVAAVTLGLVTIGGANSFDFAEANTCGSVIGPGTTCTISITFRPSAPGARSASLFLSGNVAGGPRTVTLSGTGTATGPSPVIEAVVDAWGYIPGIAPGLWVTLIGTNLAGPPQTWNLKGVQQLPTTLAGVTVTFNGTPAPLLYVSATQINALVPASIIAGPVQVAVEVNGLSSSPFPLSAKATQPAVYAPPNADGSSFFVTAALQGTALLVGNSATDPRVVRTVYPGDIVDLYMIGLGTTADASKFATHQIFSGAFPVGAQVVANVGSVSAPVLFAGLTSPGLYLVRISVPSQVEAGPQTLQVSAGASQTRSSLLLMVGAVPPSLIQNGSFESALADTWNFSVDRSGGAQAVIERTTLTAVDAGSSANINVSSAATNTAVELWQGGFSVQQGEVYRLQFWAKADTARTVRFTVVQDGGDFHNLGIDSAVPLSRDWQQYVLYFQATATAPTARLNFDFGDQTGNTWFDGISLHGTSR